MLLLGIVMRVLVALTALMAAGAFAIHELRRAAPVAAQVAAVPAPPPLPPPIDLRREDVRPQIARAIETSAPSLRSQRDVERYLDDLEQTARRNRRVSALEVEPGLAAIQQHTDPERMMQVSAEFTQRMSRLSAELDGRKDDSPPDLDRMQRRIEHESGEARESAIREFVTAVSMSPPEEQVRLQQLMSQLKENRP